MNNKESGYVNTLTNHNFHKDWVIIGKSSHPVNMRRGKVIIEPPHDLERERI